MSSIPHVHIYYELYNICILYILTIDCISRHQSYTCFNVTQCVFKDITFQTLVDNICMKTCCLRATQVNV